MRLLRLHNVPDRLHRKLQERARQNRRSVAQEVRVLLEAALLGKQSVKLGSPQPFSGTFLLTDEWIGQAKRAGRS
jgi:plasmid stability protein